MSVIDDMFPDAKVYIDGVEMDSEYLNLIIPSKVEVGFYLNMLFENRTKGFLLA